MSSLIFGLHCRIAARFANFQKNSLFIRKKKKGWPCFILIYFLFCFVENEYQESRMNSKVDQAHQADEMEKKSIKNRD